MHDKDSIAINFERKKLREELRRRIEEKSIRPEPGTSNLTRNSQGGIEEFRNGARRVKYYDFSRMTAFAFLGE